jgi:hypothetical protein
MDVVKSLQGDELWMVRVFDVFDCEIKYGGSVLVELDYDALRFHQTRSKVYSVYLVNASNVRLRVAGARAP